MKTTTRVNINAGLGLSLAVAGLLAACVVGNQARYGGPAGAGIVIRNVGDFYGPLGAYGRWETVGSYGRCWIPAGVGSDWEPYEDGSWVATDGGWYWDSDEPWGWATYHYGRWFEDAHVGWCWIPATQWAPAWVAWCEGDNDYVGWAPLPPGGGGLFGGRAKAIPPERYMFVRQRAFTDNVRPAAVTRYHPAAAGRAPAVTNVRTIGAGPSFAAIEQASGRQVRQAPAREVRQNRETAASRTMPRPSAPTAPPVPRVTAPENAPHTVNEPPRVHQPEEQRRVYGNEPHPAPGDGSRPASAAVGAPQSNESRSRGPAEKEKEKTPAQEDHRDDRGGSHDREPGAHDRGNGNDNDNREHQ